MNIRTIPAGMNFLQVLAEFLRADSAATQTALSDYTILLPTRRAVRTLQQMLSALPSATLLPRLYAIGDLDDDVLTLQMPDITALPAIDGHARLGLLINLIITAQPMPWARAQGLAVALTKLLDEAALREVSLTALENLLPADFAEHWGISLTWLCDILPRWPEILSTRGQIDSAAARQSILNSYADLWRAQPPVLPVIAAGSTGSLPATRRLLKCIAGLPRGMVVLPALDKNLPDEVWRALPETHSQRMLFNLLADFEIARDDVLPLVQGMSEHETLWQQILWPANFTQHWRDPNFRLLKPGAPARVLDGIHTVTAPNAETEAEAIALILHRAAQENKTAALVTPDRTLAARVSAKLQRFGITVNDSAGASLDQSPAGRWVRVLLAAMQQPDAINLLSLLKHPLSCFGTTRVACREAARAIEHQYFRVKDAPHRLPELLAGADETLPLRAHLSALQTPDETKSLAGWIADLRALGDQLTAEPNDAPLLWQQETGKKLWQLLLQLERCSECFPALSRAGFAELLQDRMMTVTFHAPDAHPKLQILGPLEARLHAFDVVILGGLNEGTWPAEPAADPWLSRPMRETLGLATPDEMLGLAAHDFYQLATQPRVYLTRAGFADGTPTLPSRWWQRLSAYVQACQLDEKILEDENLLAAANMIDRAAEFLPASRPAPAPDAALRPRRYSPSGIETLARNPYEFYAQKILRLPVLPELCAPADASDQGKFLHAVLLDFTREYPGALPPDAAAQLDALAAPRIAALPLTPLECDFWQQNWQRARDQFLTWQTRVLATGRRVVAMEHTLSHIFETTAGPVTLQARADRIDVDAAGNFIVVDYKSKNAPTKTEAQNLTRPQLAIEAWLLAQIGLPGHAPRAVTGAEFWPLMKTDGDMIALDGDAFAAAVETLPARLAEFLGHYLRAENPFTATVPDKLFDDQLPYLHLSRAEEWAA